MSHISISCCRNLRNSLKRNFATYVPSEKVLFTALDKLYKQDVRKMARNVEINTMEAGLAKLAAKGFQIEDESGVADVRLSRKAELLPIGVSSVSVEFDIGTRVLNSDPPEAYDIIVRKSNAADYVVVTCVNVPNFLPVQMRILPVDVPSSRFDYYCGPKFTRLPPPMLVCLSCVGTICSVNIIYVRRKV